MPSSFASRPAFAHALVLSALLALPGLPARAAEERTAYLVRDLAPGEESLSGGDVSPVGTAGNRVLLLASEPASGAELWVSDGTPLGSQLLVDACPGPCSSAVRILGSRGNQTFWVATPNASQGAEAHRRRLWVTDGTRAGTRPLTEEGMLPDENRVPEGSPLFALAGESAFFTACQESGCGLWHTDGTAAAAGTKPEPLLELPSSQGTPHALTAVGGRVFFLAGRDLWVSDGTGPGTVRLKTFARSTLGGLTAAGARLFLAADDGQGTEAWTSDGTAAGTRALTQLAPAEPFPTYAEDFDPWLFRPAGDLVYFVVNDVLHEDELWRSDGTPAGTFAVTDFGFHRPFGEERGESHFAAAGDRLLFLASDGLSPSRLWVSTGARSSTRPLADECPACPLPQVFGRGLIEAGSRVIFAGGNAGDIRAVLWTSDGTARGTVPIDLSCGGEPCGSLFDGPVPSSGGVYFTLYRHPELDLWFTDGTADGTHRLTAFRRNDGRDVDASRLQRTADGRFFFNVRDRNQDRIELWVSRGPLASSRFVLSGPNLPRNGSPSQLVPAGGRLYFVACGPEAGVWTTAGSGESTTPVATVETSHCDSTILPYGLTAVGDAVLFFSRDFSGSTQLRRVDGPAGSVSLTAFGDDRGITLGTTAVLGGRLYFEVRTSSPYQSEVWRSDGTLAGTVKAFEIPDSRLEHMTAVGDELYMLVVNSTQRIWRSDGTQAGTREILHAGSGVLSFFYQPDELLFARLGSRVYFTAIGSSSGKPELWATDGTAAGTHRVADLPEPSFNSVQSWGLTAHQGALYFFARQRDRAELWRSDGTQLGTLPLRAFADPGFDRRRRTPVPFAGALYFTAEEAAADPAEAGAEDNEGEELWKTDGTVAGTVLVRDIAPGREDSSPAFLTAAGGRLYFAATESLHGRELWETDGTAAGTQLVQDLSPLASSSSPSDLTVAGDRLYFTADDGLTGRELWALPLGGAAGCQPSPAHLCLGNGRFQVTAAWRDFQDNTGAGMAVALTGDTGYFWFFDPANVEAVVKVLDGQGLNGHHWVFYGALSSVEYTLTVTDTHTGLTRRYRNPSGVFASVGDTQGFGPLGAYSAAPATATAGLPPATATGADPAAATGSCQAGPRRLCLNGGRFAVEVAWKDFQNRTGVGQAVPLSGDTGYFWFFDAGNVELVTKVLDGTALNGKHWFFYGALSNVEYRITVTDTATGQVKTYVNPSGRFASVGDTAAF